MKKAIFIILFSAIIYLIVNQLFVNTYDGPIFSHSQSESKKYNCFLFDLKPNKDSIQLKNRKIKSPSLWIERGQQSSHFLLFFSKREATSNSYNIIIGSEKKCDSNEYLLEINGNYQVINCKDGLGYVYLVPGFEDTIKIKIKQGSSTLGWKKETIVDSVVYTKK